MDLRAHFSNPIMCIFLFYFFMLISQILYSIDQVTMLKKIQEMYMREKSGFTYGGNMKGKTGFFGSDQNTVVIFLFFVFVFMVL